MKCGIPRLMISSKKFDIVMISLSAMSLWYVVIVLYTMSDKVVMKLIISTLKECSSMTNVKICKAYFKFSFLKFESQSLIVRIY